MLSKESFRYEDYYTVVRPTDDGRVGEALVGNLHAAQLIKPRNLLPGGLSRADSMDGM